MRKLVIFLGAGLALSAMAAHAEGDADAGKAKATSVCAACHGADGNSTTPVWPSLAGQHASYIVKQLEAFKSGDRQNPLMSPQAAALSEQDMQNVAAYFSSQKIKTGTADPALVGKGEKLYRGGDAAAGVPACMACHGPDGRGNPAALYPAIAGQHAEYVLAQLKAYAAGQRTTDQAQIMRNIASQLSDDQMKAVASYVQGLHH